MPFRFILRVRAECIMDELIENDFQMSNASTDNFLPCRLSLQAEKVFQICKISFLDEFHYMIYFVIRLYVENSF